MSWLSSHLDAGRLADLKRDPLWSPPAATREVERAARAAYAAVIAAHRAAAAKVAAK